MYRLVAEVKAALWRLGGGVDAGNWIEPGKLLACSYPKTAADFDRLVAKQVGCLINLHPKAHCPRRLAKFGMTQHHFPTPDFIAPTPLFLDNAIAVIGQELQAGRIVAVHCGMGLGRTGTLLACYLLHTGAAPDAVQAMSQVRAVRPGSIETPAQEKAVAEFACRRQT